jgi:hypothetical protein
MKTLSVLFLFLTGCMEVNSWESQEETEEDSSFEESQYYEDFEFDDSYERNNCPVYYQKFEFKNNQYVIEIPSECHLNYFETGRPTPDKQYNQNILLENSIIHQEY